MTNYKGYIGQFEVDTETDLIRGKVINTRDIITFHGSTVNEAQQAFRDSVDDYLEFCASLGEAPEKPYSGKLLVRLTPKLHQDLDILAKSRGKSINKLVAGYLALMARRSRIHHTGGIFGSGKVSPRKLRSSEKSTRREKTTTREV
jgi:predicted HicB family RNase H-like nuclease